MFAFENAEFATLNAKFAVAYALLTVVEDPAALAALYADCANDVDEFACVYAKFAVYHALLALVLATVSTVPPPPPDCSTNTNFCVASSYYKT